jgi:hypothetical protein
MPDLKLTCDNCGSAFALSFEEEEVSYSPTHCPFCGDFYDTDSNELDFNDNDEDDYGLTDDDLNDDDEDDRRRH